MLSASVSCGKKKEHRVVQIRTPFGERFAKISKQKLKRRQKAHALAQFNSQTIRDCNLFVDSYVHVRIESGIVEVGIRLPFKKATFALTAQLVACKDLSICSNLDAPAEGSKRLILNIVASLFYQNIWMLWVMHLLVALNMHADVCEHQSSFRAQQADAILSFSQELTS